jgi:NADH-quinone oxidoreductase subunit J
VDQQWVARPERAWALLAAITTPFQGVPPEFLDGLAYLDLRLDMDWLAEHWLEAASLALLAAGIWWLMPPAPSRPKVVGLLLALAGTALLAVRLHAAVGPLLETVLFFLFAAAAVVCAILMITNRNPVYSALWFALVTLSTCGLFLLQFAPFLAAATVIVYAGAIVVTFVFVIMLAQQSGAAVYDQRSREPLMATIAAFILLGALLGTLETASTAAAVRGSPDPAQDTLGAGSGDPLTTRPTTDTAAANTLSRPAEDESLASMLALGRSLFGDYLFAVELAGTLLLVATIGAIAIVPRRRRGTL